MRIWTEEELQLLETLANELRTQNPIIKIFEIVEIIKDNFKNKNVNELQEKLYRLELQKNPEKLEEAQVRFTKHQQYYEEHKEEIAVRRQQHYKKHKEKIAVRNQRYRKEHKEEIAVKKQLRKIWSEENLNSLKNYINETNKEELFTKENIQLFSNKIGKPQFIIKAKINSLLKEQEKKLKKANTAFNQFNNKDLLQK